MAELNKTPTTEKFRFPCRLSFPRLMKPKAFEEGQDPRWEATGLLDPSNPKQLEGIKAIIQAASKLSKETYGVVPRRLRQLAHEIIPGAPAVTADVKDDKIEIAFYNGADKEYDGYKGMFVVPAHNSKLKPAVADRRGVQLDNEEDDSWPYAGCYVYMSVTLWAQVGKTQQKYGKRIGVNLRGVQFDKAGEPFGAGDIVADDEFEALEDDGSAPAADPDAMFG